jgi:hypothetical protein
MAFVSASKEIFQEKPQAQTVKEEKKRESSRWAGWLKPLIAIPALAALVVMMGYEARQIRNSHKETAGTEQALVASADFALRGGDRESGESTVVRVRAGEAFGLHFDFTPAQTLPGYVGEVQDETGRVMMKLGIPAERINKEVKFMVGPGRLSAGNYNLVVYGQEQKAESAVARYAFSVEIIP